MSRAKRLLTTDERIFFFLVCCVCKQGSRRPSTAIRGHWRVQILGVRDARRSACAYSILAVATPVPRHQTQVYQFTRLAQRPHTRPARERDQLRELVHSRVHLP